MDHPELVTAFCLPVLPDGLTRNGLYVLENAIANGIRVDMVNIMAMDYGDWATPQPAGQMGEYAILAASRVALQMGALFPDRTDQQIRAMLGITPMIGQNDVASEVFDLTDAQQLVQYASETGIGLLSMWSCNRDNGNGPNQVWASPNYSGIAQELYAFSAIFSTISGGSPEPVPTPPPVIDPPWSATEVYTQGNRMTHADATWEAHWWTRGEQPGTTGEWGVWHDAR